jgi:hypothetical protein
MSQLTRLLTCSLALCALAWTVGVQLSSPAATAQLILNLNGGGALEVTLPSGTTIRASSPPGTVIAPGTYQVVVNTDVPDTADEAHMFDLSGPGVNLQTDLGAGDTKTEVFAQTLAPSSTYTFQDDRQPSLGRIVFSTAATGSPSSGATGSSPVVPTVPTGTTPGSTGNSSNSGVVGSAIQVAPFRGTLAGTVKPNGTPTLTRNGKGVSTLKAGRYKITVVDQAAKSGLTLQEIRKAPVTLTGTSFVGKRTRTVDLRAGQWFFYTTFVGKKSYFIVTS